MAPSPRRGTLKGFSSPTIESIVQDDLSFIIRSIERFGVPSPDVEDVAQEVLHGAYRALPSFEPGRGRLRTWLYKIAFYQAQSFLGRARHHREVLVAHADFEPLTDPSPNSEEQAIVAQARRLVLELIQTLETHRRAVFIAYEIDEMSMLEIAETLGIPVSTGWSRLQLARKDFAEALKRQRLRTGESSLFPLAIAHLLDQERHLPAVPDEVRQRLWRRLRRAIDRERGSNLLGALRTASAPSTFLWRMFAPAQVVVGAVALLVGITIGGIGMRWIGGHKAGSILSVRDASAAGNTFAQVGVENAAPLTRDPSASAPSLMRVAAADLSGVASHRGRDRDVPGRDAPFAAEFELMQSATTAFDRGDIAAAGASLEQHARQFPEGRYAAGRDALAALIVKRKRLFK